jgi:hypothetical protein
MILDRLKISIYKNLLDYFISFNIDSREITISVNDKLNIGLIFKDFFYNLPRGL